MIIRLNFSGIMGLVNEILLLILCCHHSLLCWQMINVCQDCFSHFRRKTSSTSQTLYAHFILAGCCDQFPGFVVSTIIYAADILTSSGVEVMMSLKYDQNLPPSLHAYNRTMWRRMKQVCVGNLNIIGWDNDLSPDQLSHYLNQCRNNVNWTLRNKLQWNFNRKS